MAPVQVVALVFLAGLWVLGVFVVGPFRAVMVFDIPLCGAAAAGAGFVTLQFYKLAMRYQDEAEILEAQHRARYGINSFVYEPAPSRTPGAWPLVLIGAALLVLALPPVALFLFGLLLFWRYMCWGCDDLWFPLVTAGLIFGPVLGVAILRLCEMRRRNPVSRDQ